ncbi:MAG TPA: class I SAM-dependent methyltransferase [Chlamydiae bacterium]|nr:class I SAM-dependent methyltransferase [Chlamydiota bacterium]
MLKLSVNLIRKLIKRGNTFSNLNRKLTILPGTIYSEYAVPIEYLPSRDFNPRYGASKPVIESLQKWFENYKNDYFEMLNFMRSLNVDHIELSLNDKVKIPQPAWMGGPISSFDSLALYAMILKNKPKRYFEIGSGMTTCFARQAINDAKLSPKIVSIDPQPRGDIDSICDEFIRDGLETCDLSVFDELESGDILFFDGSHRIFMNSDVTVFFIDVLPRLKPGVIIHIHDILLPYDYPDSFKHWYWNEQYILAVYLMNAKHRINPLFPTAFVCRDKLFNKVLQKPFIDLGSSENNLSWNGGGSMWFTHTAN